MKYRVHRFNIRMTADQPQLEQFLNGLEGEVISIFPNVTITPGTWAAKVDFVFIIERFMENRPNPGPLPDPSSTKSFR